MTRGRKFALGLGVVGLLLLIGLPPWQYRLETAGLPNQTFLAKWAPIWSPPAPVDPLLFGAQSCLVQIDWKLLLVEIAGLLACMGSVIYFAARRRAPAHSDERPRSYMELARGHVIPVGKGAQPPMPVHDGPLEAPKMLLDEEE
jgi:hypothetical protein